MVLIILLLKKETNQTGITVLNLLCLNKCKFISVHLPRVLNNYNCRAVWEKSVTFGAGASRFESHLNPFPNSMSNELGLFYSLIPGLLMGKARITMSMHEVGVRIRVIVPAIRDPKQRPGH